MPKGPNGQQRPADVIGNAVHVAKIATGEEDETSLKQPSKLASSLVGASAGIGRTSEDERRAIARQAAIIRWAKEEAE